MNASCWNFAFCLVLAAGLVFAGPVQAKNPVSETRKEKNSRDRALPPEGLVIPETPDFPFRIDVVHETDSHIMAVISGHFGDFSSTSNQAKWPKLPEAFFRILGSDSVAYKLPCFLFRNLDAVKTEDVYFLSTTMLRKTKTPGVPSDYKTQIHTLSPYISCDLKVCQFWPPAFRAVTHNDMLTLLREAPPERKRKLIGVPFLFSTHVALTELKSKKNDAPVILAAPLPLLKRDQDNVIPVILASMTNVHGPLVDNLWEDYPAWLVVWLEEGPEGEFSFTGSIVRLDDGLPDFYSFQEE